MLTYSEAPRHIEYVGPFCKSNWVMQNLVLQRAPWKARILIVESTSEMLLVLLQQQYTALIIFLLSALWEKLVPQATSLKSQYVGCVVKSSRSLPRLKRRVERFLLIMWHCPGGLTMVRGCQKFSYWLWIGWFCTCLGSRSLPAGLWISHNEYCWISVSIDGRNVWGFLFCHHIGITLCNLVCEKLFKTYADTLEKL